MKMRGRIKAALAGALALLAGSAGSGQLLPRAPLPPLPDVVGTATGAVDALDRAAIGTLARARQLADARLTRLGGLVRAHPLHLEMTDLGPAVRGQVIAIDPAPDVLTAAARVGFTLITEEEIAGLDIRMVTLEAPARLSLRQALRQLERLAPGTEFTANHIHLPGGAASASASSATLAQGSGGAAASVGIIDGGVGAHPALRGPVQQRGFAAGAPAASAHGTAVASLVAGQGPIRGAAPGARLLVADVYGSDPAGGNAAAIARALGWMAERQVPVVAVSLVGPPNSLLARAVARARERGVHIVAAVGNDGPAAPPAYPASYPGVVAVTGVDGRNRVLIEAGRAAHLDYAAPGADMAAAAPGGGMVAVRGTSYAVPLVAGRLAHHMGKPRPLAALDAEAARGNRALGRGLVCGDCRTPLSKK